MSARLASAVASGLGFLGIALGAFGAHGLKEVLARYETAGTWQTAVFYHLVHTVMLFVLAGRQPLPTGPWVAFVFGVLVFSGSLYILSVTGIRWLGAITPIGGVSFLVGWLWLGIQGFRPARRGPEA